MTEYALGTGPITCRSCQKPLRHITGQCPECGKPVDSATLLMLVTAKVDMGEERQTIVAQLRNVLASMPSLTPAARAHFGRSGPAGKVAALLCVQASGDASEFPCSVLEMSYVRASGDLKVEIVRTLGMAGTEESVKVLQRIIDEEKDPEVLRSFGEKLGGGDEDIEEITFPSLKVEQGTAGRREPPPAVELPGNGAEQKRPAGPPSGASGKEARLPPGFVQEKDDREFDALFDRRVPSSPPVGPERPVSRPPESLLGSRPPSSTGGSTPEPLEDLFGVEEDAFAGSASPGNTKGADRPAERKQAAAPPAPPQAPPQQAPPQQTDAAEPQQTAASAQAPPQQTDAAERKQAAAPPAPPQAPAPPPPHTPGAPVPGPPSPPGKPKKRKGGGCIVGLVVAVVGALLGIVVTVVILFAIGQIDRGMVPGLGGEEETGDTLVEKAEPAPGTAPETEPETQPSPAEEETETGREQDQEEPPAEEETETPGQPDATETAPPGAGDAHELSYEVEASSFHKKYPPSHLADGDPSTVWQEEGGTWSVGHKLTFSFPEPVTVVKMGVVVGYVEVDKHKGDRFPQNNRLEEAKVIFEDGTEQVVHFEDERQMQWVELEHDQPVDELVVQVKGVYRGDDYNDNAIAEIELWGY